MENSGLHLLVYPDILKPDPSYATQPRVTSEFDGNRKAGMSRTLENSKAQPMKRSRSFLVGSRCFDARATSPENTLNRLHKGAKEIGPEGLGPHPMSKDNSMLPFGRRKSNEQLFKRTYATQFRLSEPEAEASTEVDTAGRRWTRGPRVRKSRSAIPVTKKETRLDVLV